MPIEFDADRLVRAIREIPESMAAGARTGLHDVLDEWQRDARDKAPIDKGTLRLNIEQELEGSGLDLSGNVSANVWERGFNYGYYIHEVKGNGFKGRSPGTIGDFIDRPAMANRNKWLAHIEDEIETELKRKGW